ncbi:hypothetical protein C0995_000410 [Termitomyces sp. Mi166|nr:hypothetical protein C0995_000410 [Termitomyces sp. Mi166\
MGSILVFVSEFLLVVGTEIGDVEVISITSVLVVDGNDDVGIDKVLKEDGDEEKEFVVTDDETDAASVTAVEAIVIVEVMECALDVVADETTRLKEALVMGGEFRCSICFGPRGGEHQSEEEDW